MYILNVSDGSEPIWIIMLVQNTFRCMARDHGHYREFKLGRFSLSGEEGQMTDGKRLARSIKTGQVLLTITVRTGEVGMRLASSAPNYGNIPREGIKLKAFGEEKYISFYRYISKHHGIYNFGKTTQ